MTKVAVLIDGGFFLKRLKTVCPEVDPLAARQVDEAIGRLVKGHLEHLHRRFGGTTHDSLLYRAFYYDAAPYTARGHTPITKKSVDYAKSESATLRLALFDHLRRRAAFAVRLGEVRRERAWILKEAPQKALLDGSKVVADLTDEDFHPGLRQKAVDMRLALDIASITLKKQAEIIVLVTGDSDFVPAAKLARREGMRVILDPLWMEVAESLFEHIDGLYSAFPKPKNRKDP